MASNQNMPLWGPRQEPVPALPSSSFQGLVSYFLYLGHSYQAPSQSNATPTLVTFSFVKSLNLGHPEK